MPQSPDVTVDPNLHIPSSHTLQEIYQQPALWADTVTRVRDWLEKSKLASELRRARLLLTGAGTSAYVATSVAAAWPRAAAVPTTDLLVDAERYIRDVDVMISLARSGNSPESAAVVNHVRQIKPSIPQLAITCSQENALAGAGLDGLIVLDPRTNDRSLVMTSAFSNLVAAGLSLAHPDAMAAAAENGARSAQKLLPELDHACHRLASHVRDRIVILSSSPLLGWGREAALKTLEMTAGRYAVLAESYLGLRHGPMSFVRPDTVVLCLLSSDPLRRLYELDLVRELREKRLGFLVGITDGAMEGDVFDALIPAVLPEVEDALRTPFEIIVPQLLGYHLSRGIGIDPDNPSPDGVINRVVQGVTIHTAKSVQKS